MKKRNEILELSFEFALSIIKFCEQLEDKRKYIIARQLLKSRISVGVNLRKAQNAESKADFFHKLKISAKEAEETKYCLLSCKQSKSFLFDENIYNQLISMKKLMSKILSTSINNLKKKNYEFIKKNFGGINYHINTSI